jgi:hypothetical protein
MKIKKNAFSTFVLELFFPSIANCRKLKIKKIQKSTSPTVQCTLVLYSGTDATGFVVCMRGERGGEVFKYIIVPVVSLKMRYDDRPLP